ncbi:MAG TPA: class I SAM-dependent methyltransferase [Polyangia bacterium]|jgi:SAM-dependent methyltransferase
MSSPVSEAASGASAAGLRFALAARSCPVCQSTDAVPFAPANFDPAALDAFAFASRKLPEYMHYALVVCRDCDLLYSNPAPSRAAIEHAYVDAAFDASDESHYAAVTYGALLRRFSSDLPDRQGALDIGTGDGAFLEQLLADGFTGVVGVEPSAAPIAAAKPEVRGFIQHGPFQAANFQPGSLRLVTCFQTIEHVYDPMQLCQEVRGLLRPGGAFFVVCHNRRALLARAMGLRSPIFDIEHLQLFSPRSVRVLLKRAGFSRVEVRPVVNRYPLNYWARLFPLPAALKTPALARLRASSLGAIPIAAPVGNLAAVAYT